MPLTIEAICVAVSRLRILRRPRELRDAAVQVFLAHAVISAVVTALEHCPERLDPIGVSLIANEFSAVSDGFMPEIHPKLRIPAMIVRVNRRALRNPMPDESLQALLACSSKETGSLNFV